MSIVQAIIATTNIPSSGGGSAQTGDGTPGSVTTNGFTYTLTPTTSGSGSPGTANPGDVITWTVTTSPADANRLLYIWVDNGTLPGSNFVENTDNGTFTLNGSGTGTFTLTVVSNPTHGLFRMYIGYSLYQGFVTHGNIGM